MQQGAFNITPRIGPDNPERADKAHIKIRIEFLPPTVPRNHVVQKTGRRPVDVTSIDTDSGFILDMLRIFKGDTGDGRTKPGRRASKYKPSGGSIIVIFCVKFSYCVFDLPTMIPSKWLIIRKPAGTEREVRANSSQNAGSALQKPCTIS